jgi:RHS repeat-associated protein
MGNMTSYSITSPARSGTLSYAGTTPKLMSVLEGTSTIPVQYDAAGNELTGTRVNGPGSPSEQRWYTPRNSMHLDYLSASGTKSRPCTVGQSCPNAPSGDKYYEFAYDGRGVRMLERLHTGSSLSTKHYTYSPELSLLGYKAPGKNGAGIEAIWFAGAPIAQDAWGTHGQTKWTFTDHLGTPLLQTNSSKAVVWRAEYEPYGNVWVMRNGTKDDQPLRFPGQERLFDGSTGTEERYNIFRFFRSGWGKYTQADPLGLASGTNLFAYASATPVIRRDRLGLKDCGPLPPETPGMCGKTCADRYNWGLCGWDKVDFWTDAIEIGTTAGGALVGLYVGGPKGAIAVGATAGIAGWLLGEWLIDPNVKATIDREYERCLQKCKFMACSFTQRNDL